MSSSSWAKTGRSNHSEQRFITKSCTIKSRIYAMIMKVMYVTYERKCFRVTKDTWSWKFTAHKRKQTLACFYMQNMQKRSPLPSSSHLKTQMCSSCHFHLSVSLLVRCTLRVAPRPEKNLLMCRRLLLPLVKIRAAFFLDCIRSQAVTL